MKSHLQLQRTALLALLIGSSDSMAVRNVPHGHQGKLRPITPGPFAIKLTASQEATLKAGDPVIIKQSTPESSSGGSICIQDVEAPVSAVWHQILDLDNYNTKAPKVVQSNNYVVQQHADGRATLKTKLVFRIFPGLSVGRQSGVLSHCACFNFPLIVGGEMSR